MTGPEWTGIAATTNSNKNFDGVASKGPGLSIFTCNHASRTVNSFPEELKAILLSELGALS
jgi:hypothetical protein